MTDYDVGRINKDYTSKWIDEGYRIERGKFVKGVGKEKRISKRLDINIREFGNSTKTVYDEAGNPVTIRYRVVVPGHVSGIAGQRYYDKKGKPNTYFLGKAFSLIEALEDTFGTDKAEDIMEKATYARVLGEMLPIRPSDRRVVVTKKGLLKTPSFRDVEVGEIVPITLYYREVGDEIDIVEIRYEAYIYGMYTGRKKRSIGISGSPVIRLGIKPPEGYDEDFIIDIIKEIKKDLFDEDAVDGEMIGLFLSLNEWGSSYQGPNDASEDIFDTTYWNWKWKYLKRSSRQRRF